MAKRRGAILGTVVMLAGLAWAFGVLDSLRDIAAIRAAVEEAGAWGPALFVLVAMASFAVFLLSFPVWASAALWPLPLAFAFSFAAALLASVLTYALTFALGRRRARAHVPASLAAWEERLEARPVLALISLRTVLWANPLVDMLLAVSRVPPRVYIVGTVLGLVGPTAFQVGLGAGGGAVLSRLAGLEIAWWQWTLAVALAAATAAALRWRKRRTR